VQTTYWPGLQGVKGDVAGAAPPPGPEQQQQQPDIMKRESRLAWSPCSPPKLENRPGSALLGYSHCRLATELGLAAALRVAGSVL
jgi:hypothetical protein